MSRVNFRGIALIFDLFFQTFHFVEGIIRKNFPLYWIILPSVKGVCHVLLMWYWVKILFRFFSCIVFYSFLPTVEFSPNWDNKKKNILQNVNCVTIFKGLGGVRINDVVVGPNPIRVIFIQWHYIFYFPANLSPNILNQEKNWLC